LKLTTGSVSFDRYIWESKADGNFAVIEDTENEPLGRGTEIRIHLKEEASEYAQEDKLRELVKKYSEFINFPIYLWSSKEVDVEVPVDEDEEADKETPPGRVLSLDFLVEIGSNSFKLFMQTCRVCFCSLQDACLS
jgi:HSP90 family molecular chaperone